MQHEARQVSRRWWGRAVLLGSAGVAAEAALADPAAAATPTTWSTTGNDAVAATDYLGVKTRPTSTCSTPSSSRRT